MRRILAIAGLAMRNAIRSKMVLTLLLMLALCVVVLPLFIEGDGTLRGQVQILLTYSLGLASALLSIATVWSGCAAVSTDIRDHHIDLMVTKPVYRAQIWLGKWLGLLVLNAILLLFTGLSVYGVLSWRTRPAQVSNAERLELDREILVSRRIIRPVPPDVSASARAEFEERQKDQKLDPDTPAVRQLQRIEARQRMQSYTVESGARRGWTIPFPEAPPPDTSVYLRYQFSISAISQEEIKGLWLFGAGEGRDPSGYRVSHVANSRQTLEIPSELIRNNELFIEFANVHTRPLLVIFDPDDGIEVMYAVDRFELNLVRSLLVVFCQIGFLAALSVSAGTCFTMPVAAFCSISLVVMMMFNRTIQAIASGEAGAMNTESKNFIVRGFNYFVEGLYAAISRVLAPLQQTSPLELLAGGELVSWSMLGHNAAIRLGLYAGLLALLGIWMFHRKEVGRPQ